MESRLALAVSGRPGRTLAFAADFAAALAAGLRGLLGRHVRRSRRDRT